MTRLLYSLAALPIFVTAALAQPMQLTDRQLDKISAGYFEIDVSNTSLTIVSIWFRPSLYDETTPNLIVCPTCYLLIVNPVFSVASHFEQPATPPIVR